MNGSQAKTLRALAFKHSQGKPSKYGIIKRFKAFWDEKKKEWKQVPRYQTKCTGYRAVYQALKKAYYRQRRNDI